MPQNSSVDTRSTVELGGKLTAIQVADVALDRAHLAVDLHAIHERLRKARVVVDRVLASGTPAYGVNRALGPLRDIIIPTESLGYFQHFVIASHAAAIGEPLTRTEGRAALVVRLNTMATGSSGASTDLFDSLLALLVNDVIPVIPAEGSVGAADLSQMAAIGMVIIGYGRAWLPGTDHIARGAEALAAAGLEPLFLGPKDGLALVGSNALSTAVAALTHRRADLLTDQADLVAALSVEALAANVSPFDAIALSARPFHGQQVSGTRIRQALAGGDLAASTVHSHSLQDHISIRTVPQVHGALRDELDGLSATIGIEISSAADNPFLDVDRDEFIPNGNFSITGLAIGFDALRIALAHVAILAERRVAQLTMKIRQGLTLIEQIEQVKSGKGYITPVILAQTASALVGEVKHAAMPVSITGTTVGDGVEDHASMAYQAVRVTDQVLNTVDRLFAVEALLAATVIATEQRIEPRTLGGSVTRLVETISEIVARNDMTSDIIAAVAEVLRRERRGEDLSDIPAAPVAPPTVAQDREIILNDQLK